MDRYFCIISLPVEPVADLCVLDAGDDGEALAKAQRIALDWPPAATVSLFQGERLIGVLEGGFRRAA